MIQQKQIVTTFNQIAGYRHDCDGGVLPALGTSGQIQGTTLVALQSGTGAGQTVLAINSASKIGVYQQVLGTLATNRAGIVSSWLASATSAAEQWSIQCATAIGLYAAAKLNIATLSTGTNEFAWVMGLVDAISASAGGGAQVSPQGIYLLYDRQIGTDWRIVSKNGGGTTNPGSSVVVGAGTEVFLQVKKPAGSDVVNFYINSALVGSQSTNTPNGIQLGFCCAGFRSAGTAAVTAAQTDFVEFSADIPAGRT